MLRKLTHLLLLWAISIAPESWAQQSHTEPVEIIVVATMEEAQVILAGLKNGADFASLAREQSIDPSASAGGSVGALDLDGVLPEIREALWGIKPGEFTGIVKMREGFAILKVTAQGPGKEHDAVLGPSMTPTGHADIASSTGSKRPHITTPTSGRLVTNISGYVEFYEALRQNIPPDPKWALDLKGACTVRREAPVAAIEVVKKALADETASTDPSTHSFTQFTLAQLYASQGDVDNEISQSEELYRFAMEKGNQSLAALIEEVLGVSYLHRASFDDHGNSSPVDGSRLFPMHPGAAHMRPGDVDKAIDFLGKAMRRDPSNQELQWLLNLAYMTADLYPTRVPKEFLIPPSVFASKEDLGWFPDVAPAAGLAAHGNAGGVIIDDFDGDGLLDVMTSSVDDCAPLHLFHNNGDGTFTDHAVQAGLSEQIGGLNIIQADYNNDGCVDVLVLRGGWEFPRRRSLLRNNCDGTFTDVTAAAHLLEPVRASQSAVWVDIDNDGKLDLFIANENSPSQLFLNKGDGTFVDISREAGIDRVAFSKGVVSADYDGDGFPDLYVSNFNGPNFLYHNNGDRTFTEVANQAGVEAPWMSFAAWFFDYDNDGLPDLFVTSYFFSLEEVARSYMGLPTKQETLKLFRNKGNGTFEDVTARVGLDRIFMPMGSNFGDIDNDGYLDIYLGMGNPSFASQLPNVLLHNQEGKRFVDISTSSGTGALAKGHGVAFADLENSGDEDIFILMGGPSPGDRYDSRLFKNPGGHGNDWITLRLVGTRSNRSAIGARITVTVEDPLHRTRTISRTVGSGGSFGASPLEQHIGLGRASRITSIEVYWPASKSTQRFQDVKPNQFLEMKELESTYTTLQRPTFHLGGSKENVLKPDGSHRNVAAAF